MARTATGKVHLPTFAGKDQVHPGGSGLPALGQVAADAIAVPEQVQFSESGAVATAPGVQPGPVSNPETLRTQVEESLRRVFDPELPVNIVDLGLIYGIEWLAAEACVRIRMTLTAPACPVAGALVGQVAAAAAQVPGVGTAEVRLVWDPPWSQDRIDDAAKLALGLL